MLGNSDAFLLDPDAGAEITDGATADAARVEPRAAHGGGRRVPALASRRRSRSTSTGCGCSASTGRRRTTTASFSPRTRRTPSPARAPTCSPAATSTSRSCGASERAWYVNPGSVGLGYDHLQPEDDFRFDAWASYAIVEAASVEFHRVPFDLEELTAVTRASGLPLAGGSLQPLPAFLERVRLYNSQLSGNCWKVRQILALRGIEYERVEVDVFDRSNRPELLGGKNPALRVPTLELDDGEFLAESNAILWYFGDGSRVRPRRPARAGPRAPVDVLRAVRGGAVDRGRAVLDRAARRAGEVRGRSWRRSGAPATARSPRSTAISTAATGSSATASRSPTSRSTRTRTSPRRAASTSGGTRTSQAWIGRVAGGARLHPARRVGGGVETVSVAQLRRYVVAHQGYATRFRRARAADVAAAIRRLGCVQLDSISTVGRAHRLTLGSRIGAYPEASVSRLLEERPDLRVLGARGLPRPDRGLPAVQAAHGAPARAALVGPEARPRPGGEGARARRAARRTARCRPGSSRAAGGGGMWNWKPEKRILEDLFAAGEVVVAGRDGFQRLYDLPERVIPREHLDAPAPSEEEFRRGYVLRAVRGPRRADRVGDRRALPLPGRRQGDAAGRRRARGGGARAAGGGRRRRAAGGRAGRCRDRRRAGGRRPPLPVRQPASGTAPFLERVFGFTPRDRGLQAGATAGIRLLRAAVPVRRPARRARRPEVRPRPRACCACARSTSSRGCGARARSRPRSTRRWTGSPACSVSNRRTVTEVSPEEARRIAVRAQLLDGSARGVLDTVRRLGFLQMDPISTVAPPQYLVLWCRLGPVRPRRARPPALGGAEARRGGRVHLTRSRTCRSLLARMRRRRERQRARARGSPPS